MALFTRIAPARLALSAVLASTVTLVCHAQDAKPEPAAETQPANTSPQADPTASESLDDLLKQSDNPSAQQADTASESPQASASSANGAASAPAQEIDKEPETAQLPTIPVAAPEQPKSHRAVQIEEIIVTATKREESLREIPQSITAFGGDALEKSGIQSVDQIVRMSPGVNFVDGGQQAAHITIRGISSNSNGNQTTGTIFGNVSLTDPYLQIVTLDPNPFDLKSVEILKGPQGTLFGAGGFGGAIRYVPEAPKMGVWETKYFAEYTTLAESDKGAPIFGAATNIPIGTNDTAAARLVGIQRRDPGYYDDTARHLKDINTLKQTGLRGALSWQPTSAWDFKFLYAYQKMFSPDLGFADNADGRLSRGDTLIPSSTDNKFQLGNFSVSYAFDWATATSETAVIKKSVYFVKDSGRLINPLDLLQTLGIPSIQLDTNNDTRTVSQEFRLTSPTDSDSPWKWVGGLFGSKETYAAIIDVPFGGVLPITLPLPLPLNLISASNQLNLGTLNVHAKIQEIALFGEVTRQLGDDWSLSIGARAYRTNSGGLVDNTGLVFTGTTPTDMDVVEKGISPKASLTWHATEDIMSYATVSRGYRVGGVQPGIVTAIAQPDAPRFFKSDSLMNYELGSRTTWLENTLHADFAAYYLVWKNPQTNVSSTKDGLSNYFTNVGGVKGRGIEASIEWLPPIDGVALTLGGGFNRTTTTVPFALSSSKTVAVGTVFPQSPKWQTAATIAYAPDLGDWKPSIAITHTYLGKATTDLNKELPIFGYQQLDVNISLANTAFAWLPNLSLIGTNLLDERGVVSRDGTPPGNLTGEYTDVTYTRPRAITLRLNGRF